MWNGLHEKRDIFEYTKLKRLAAPNVLIPNQGNNLLLDRLRKKPHYLASDFISKLSHNQHYIAICLSTSSYFDFF